ncbi:MAG: VWA domain-containing protein [Acidobacteria bacterium]|nr:VWA domain-containing protein [Acidobacteriota bacterium]
MIALRYPLLLLLLVPGLWAAWRASYRWGIPSARPTGRIARVLARALPAILMGLLVLAASGPELRRVLKGRAPVVDFAVVLDGSSSMRALDDGRESRWDAARRLLRTFILRRSDDRFALVLFSAHPVTLSPLSADHARLWGTLRRLNLDSRDDGTAIGSALMTAVRRLSESPARSRVILLLTDGAQNRGRVSPEEAASEARLCGIRIHTVLLGKPGAESLYPLEGGGQAWLKVDTDPETLHRIAAATGGEALAANDPAGLERSLAAIDHLEKTALPVDPPSEGEPLALWVLLAAALVALPLAADLARKRGRPRPSWTGAP